MRMREFVVASLVATMFWTMAEGRQSVDTATPVDPSTISFEHDGVGVKGFALYFMDAQGRSIRIDVGKLRIDKTGKAVAKLPRLPPGTYSVDVVAYNKAGESPRAHAQPSQFIVTGAKSHERDLTGASTAPPKSSPPDHAKEDESAPQPKRGLLSRVYRGIVGADDGGSGEK